MEATCTCRPVKSPLSDRPLTQAAAWPDQSLQSAVELQRLLAIGDRDWHALKGQRSRRAAEQLAAALVQLLSGDDPRRRSSTPARDQAIALAEHALFWLRAEISDPGCPSHGREAAVG
jgi:DnaJ-domain-containing protein 1